MKKYTLEIESDGNGIRMKGVNDGFTALELLGLVEAKKNDIIAQIRGDIVPEIEHKRIVKVNDLCYAC